MVVVKKNILSPSQSTLFYRQTPYTIKSFSPKITKETKPSETNDSNVGDNKAVETGSATNDNKVQGTPLAINNSKVEWYYDSQGNWVKKDPLASAKLKMINNLR